MPKPYNKKLNEDISLLKILHAKKDKSEFDQLKAEIMKRHSISKATVYRELKKDTPGSYDRKRSERPVTIKEIQMVRELLEAQCKVQDVISVMERKTGMPYSWDRIDRIREAIKGVEAEGPPRLDRTNGAANPPLLSKEGSMDEQSSYNSPPLLRGSTRRGRGSDIESEGEIKGEHTPSFGHPSPEGNNESAFGDNLRVFIDELMDAERVAEGAYITVKLGGMPYRLSRKMVKDITMIITNYAECHLASVQLKRPEPEKEEEYLLFNRWYIKEDEPLPPLEELIKKQEAVLRKQFGPGGFNDLERNPVKKKEEGPCDISELNRIRIFHLVAEKIRSAVSGSFITLKELKELNEINRYFKENGEY
jgi:hypothetical protein